MTKKLKALEAPAAGNAAALATYNNTFSRFVAVKEDEAQKTKKELLILWTDYFKPEHLATFPDLHDTFWKAAKLCSACKVHITKARLKSFSPLWRKSTACSGSPKAALMPGSPPPESGSELFLRRSTISCSSKSF